MAAILIPPGDTRLISLPGMGVGVSFKISGEQTGGLFSVVEHPIEPGALVRPHMHTREDQFSYVLEGEIGTRVGDQIFHSGPGSYIYKPRGVPHTFWNPGPAPARVIEFMTPGGLENFFAELSQVLQASRPPDMAKMADIYARYGIADSHLEWIPELVEKYKLRPQA